VIPASSANLYVVLLRVFLPFPIPTECLTPSKNPPSDSLLAKLLGVLVPVPPNPVMLLGLDVPRRGVLSLNPLASDS